MKKRKLLSLILALALTLSVLAGCSTPELPAASTPPSRTPVSESVSAKRVDDFYAAINETVLKEHDAEKTGGWNWFYDLEDKSYQEQKAIIQAAATAPGDVGSSEYKLGILYALAIDQARRDAEGVTYFNELMKPVMEAGTIEELMDALAVLQYCYGFDTLLNIEVLALDDTPGEYTAQIKNMNFGLDVSDFEYEEAEEENRTYFTDYLAHLLTLTGRKDGEKATGEVYEFVKDIVASRNEGEYKKISVDDLQKQLPNIDPQAYLEKIFHTMPTELNTRETASLSVLNSYLTREQMRKFLKFVHDDNVYCKYYEAVYILFHTGLRISEFCGLTLRDIDLENKVLNIDHQLQRTSDMRLIVELTKTNAGTRKIPMTDNVARCFQGIIEDREPPRYEKVIDGYTGFLFLDKDCNPLVAMHWEHRFNHMVKRYNDIWVQMPNITPHV